jgi:hypothetical protein
MSTKLETARRAADYARAGEAREKQVGRDLAERRSVAEAALHAAGPAMRIDVR